MDSSMVEDREMKERREKGLWRFFVRLICAVLPLPLIVGCGYTFSGSIKSAYPTIKTVYVDTFSNRTSEPNVENIFRSAFSSEIVQRGHFTLVASKGEAGAIFRGTIANIHSVPLAYKTGTSFSAEDRITMTMELSFEDTSSGRTLWSNNAYIGTVDYQLTGAGATDISRRAALTKLAADSAEKIYRLMMSDF